MEAVSHDPTPLSSPDSAPPSPDRGPADEDDRALPRMTGQVLLAFHSKRSVVSERRRSRVAATLVFFHDHTSPFH
jgi:hypothetical protein